MSQVDDVLERKIADTTIYVTVGWKKYAVSRSNIMKYPNSKLAKLIKKKSRKIFIDRDETIFRDIVNYLRYDYIDLYSDDFDIERQISFQSYLIKQSVRLIRILTEFIYYEIPIPTKILNNLIQIFFGKSVCDNLPNIASLNYDTDIISNQLSDIFINQDYKIIQLNREESSKNFYQILDQNYNHILADWVYSLFLDRQILSMIAKKDLELVKIYQDKQAFYQDPDCQEYLCLENGLFSPEFIDNLISLFD